MLPHPSHFLSFLPFLGLHDALALQMRIFIIDSTQKNAVCLFLKWFLRWANTYILNCMYSIFMLQNETSFNNKNFNTVRLLWHISLLGVEATTMLIKSRIVWFIEVNNKNTHKWEQKWMNALVVILFLMKQVSHTVLMLEQDRSWSEKGSCPSSPTFMCFFGRFRLLWQEEPNTTTDHKDPNPPTLI